MREGESSLSTCRLGRIMLSKLLRVWHSICLTYFLAKVAKSFVIYSPTVKKCLQANPVNKRNVTFGPCRLNDDFFRWRWTTDGQIQNMQTGFCVEINDYAIYENKHIYVYLGVCNFRKHLQVFMFSWLK